jgi:hypothetical protein
MCISQEGEQMETLSETAGLNVIAMQKFDIAYEQLAPHLQAHVREECVRRAGPQLLEALNAMTTLMQIAADEIDTDNRHPMRGYGGKTVRENIYAARAAILSAEGRNA